MNNAVLPEQFEKGVPNMFPLTVGALDVRAVSTS